MELIRRTFYWRPATLLGAILAAAWFGAILGVTTIALLLMSSEGTRLDELWVLPILVLLYGTIFGLPTAILGLVAIGLPLAHILWRLADRRWMLVVAAVLGMVTGRLLYFVVDQTFLFGNDNLTSLPLHNYGLWIGGWSGLLWFIYARNLVGPTERIE